MLRPSPNHGTQRLPNDDDDDGDQHKTSKPMKIVNNAKSIMTSQCETTPK